MFKFLKSNKGITIAAPCNGEIVTIDQVPDAVFAQKMVGDGFAIIPSSNDIHSPVDGEVIQVFPTYHAICLKSTDGLEIIVHIGIDTVELKGEGFTCHTSVGANVKAGDLLLSFSPEILAAKGKNSITPVVITNQEVLKSLKVETGLTHTADTVAKITLK
ncbi:MAG: PTS glucose transporter subunit IIA [Clostridia bacterium]|nr:PTS glucose transporter subunit IIA [Clostridia bacterium]